MSAYLREERYTNDSSSFAFAEEFRRLREYRFREGASVFMQEASRLVYSRWREYVTDWLCVSQEFEKVGERVLTFLYSYVGLSEYPRISDSNYLTLCQLFESREPRRQYRFLSDTLRYASSRLETRSAESVRYCDLWEEVGSVEEPSPIGSDRNTECTSQISEEAESLLESNIPLAQAVKDAVDEIVSHLSQIGLDCRISIEKWVDGEVEDWERLAIRTTVPAEDQKRLLKIWEEVDKAIQQRIGRQMHDIITIFSRT